MAKSDIGELKKKLIAEIRKTIDDDDSWLLIHIEKSDNGRVKISPDTSFAGYEQSRELRGPRWRTLENARNFSSIGYKHIVAGKLGVLVLANNIKNNKAPKGIIAHKSAVSEWFPTMGGVKPVVNSVKGFVDPTLPENKGLGAKRPSSTKRKRLKDGKSCHFCKSTGSLTLHHLIRREVGGATETENLLVVCRDCHDKVHDGEIDDLELVLEVSTRRFQNLMEIVESGDV